MLHISCSYTNLHNLHTHIELNFTCIFCDPAMSLWRIMFSINCFHIDFYNSNIQNEFNFKCILCDPGIFNYSMHVHGYGFWIFDDYQSKSCVVCECFFYTCVFARVRLFQNECVTDGLYDRFIK